MDADKIFLTIYINFRKPLHTFHGSEQYLHLLYQNIFDISSLFHLREKRLLALTILIVKQKNNTIITHLTAQRSSFFMNFFVYILVKKNFSILLIFDSLKRFKL